MSGVKTELERLKRRVRKVAPLGLSAEEDYAMREALTERILHRCVSEDVSEYKARPCDHAPGYICARERLALKILEIHERRQRAAERERERKREARARRPASEFVKERMRELDQQTAGERRPWTPASAETGNPIIERLRRRAQQFAEETEE